MSLFYSHRRLLEGTNLPTVSWAGLPLLLMAFLYGLPIGRELTSSTVRIAGELHDATLERVSTVGYEKTFIVVFVVGSLYLLGAIAAWRGRAITLPLIKRQWPLVVLTIFVGASALWAYSPNKVIMNFGHSMGILFVAVSAVLRYRKEPLLFVSHFGFALGLNIILQVVAVVALPSIAIECDDRWRGLTTNSNTLGSIAYCTIWANGLVMLYFRGKKRMFSLFFLALALVVLLGSQSKTSLFCVVLAIGLGYVLYRLQKRRHIKLIYLVFVFLAFWIGIFLSLEIISFNISLSGINNYLGRSADFSGRTEIWALAIDLFLKNFWLGYGFDDNSSVIFTSSFRHISFHNGFLDLAVRGGFFGIVIFFTMLKKVMIGIYSSGCNKHILSVFFPFVLSLILYNQMETSLVVPRNLMWLLFIFIAFLVESKRG